MKFLLSVFLILCLVSIAQSQNNFEFPKDLITNKFSISQVVEISGKTKLEIFQSIRGIESKFMAYAWEIKEKDIFYKGCNVSNISGEKVDSSRLFYKVQLTQVGEYKLSGNNRYGGFVSDMYVYVKEGKYKIELTNFSVSEINIKMSGSADAIEEKNSTNKKWMKIKMEMFADATIIKDKIIESIAIYFKKSEF